MGKQKYQQKIEQLFSHSPVVSYNSIKKIVHEKKKVKQYTKQLVRNLIRSGKIKPLLKGYYTTHNESSFAVFCLQPSYLGLQDALSYHGLWEQETIPIILTAKKVRTGIRKVLGSNILIRHIDPKYYFGIEYNTEDVVLPYSDIEKTLIDMIHFKQNINPEVRKEFKKRIKKNKLKEYLQYYPIQTKERVLNIIFPRYI